MPKIIEVPGTGNVAFPDEMSDSDIESALKKHASSTPAATNLPRGVSPLRLPPGVTVRPEDEKFDAMIRQREEHPLGSALSMAGRLPVAALADLGFNIAAPEEGYHTENVKAAGAGEVQPAESLAKQELSTPLRMTQAGARGLLEGAPKMAAVAGLQAGGVPFPVGAGFVFGQTEQGFSPKQAVIAAALPFVGKYSGQIAGKIASRFGVDSPTALNWIKGVAGTAGPAGALVAEQESEIRKLPKEQQHDARIEMWANIAGQAALGPMGVKFEKGTPKEFATGRSLEMPEGAQPPARPLPDVSTFKKPGTIDKKAPFSGVELAPETSQPLLHATMLEQKNPMQLRVAAKAPSGEVIEGKPGQLHMNLKFPEGSEMGFVTPEGKYLTREEAAKTSASAKQKGGPNAVDTQTEQVLPGVRTRVQAEPAGNEMPAQKGGEEAGARGNTEAEASAGKVPLTPVPEEQLKLNEVRDVDRILIKEANKPHPESTIDSTIKKVEDLKGGFTNEAVNAIVNELRNTDDPNAVLAKWRKLKEDGYSSLQEAKKTGDMKNLQTGGYKKQAANEALEVIAEHGTRLGFPKEVVDQAKMLREKPDTEKFAPEVTPEPTVEEVTPLEPQSGAPLEPAAPGARKENAPTPIPEEKPILEHNLDETETKAAIPETATPESETKGAVPETAEVGPGLVGMGADLNSFYNWLETTPQAVRKTGLQTFIEKLAKFQSTDWRASIQQGIPAARALKEYFRGMEKGGVAGRKAATEELKMADRWLEADANNIRQSLIKLVNESLPVSERGRFVTAIANATKRPPLLSGDVEGMYRKAAEVAGRIEYRADEVRKNDTIEEIKKTVTKAIASPSVDVQYKSRILDAVKRLGFSKLSSAREASLKATREYIASGAVESVPDAVVAELDLLNKVPAKELPMNVLEAIRDRVELLHKLGRLKVKTREALWAAEKEDIGSKMEKSPSVQLDAHPEFRPQPGEKATFSLKLRNFINRQLERAAMTHRGITPPDVIFDIMDKAMGKYNGFLSRTFRGRVDSGQNRYMDRFNEKTDPIVQFAKSNKITNEQFQRVGTYGDMQQEGGRDRLIAQGADPKVLDNIQKTMTPTEMKLYQMMRDSMDSQFPEIQSLMRNLYNMQVNKVDNYWPLQRDSKLFEPVVEREAPSKTEPGEDVQFDDLAMWKSVSPDFFQKRTSQTEKGFTKERLPEASTPVKINAMEVYLRHMHDTAYLLEMQRDVKMLGEIARSDEFLKKYGAGQAFMLDWMDTVARNGGVSSLQRIALLDAIRRNANLGIIGFRPSSQLVHNANIPLGMFHAGGPGWYFKAARQWWDKDAQAWMKKNFAETFGSSEFTIDETQAAKILGIPVGKLTPAAFYFVRYFDRFNRQNTALGRYMKILAEKGEDPADFKNLPLDEEARNEALIRSRRATASAFPKDVPQAISRGSLTGGNVSVARTIGQFQLTFLDQFSNMSHDFWRAGLQNLDPKQTAGMAAVLAAMVLFETGIKTGVSSTIASATGHKPKKETSYGEHALVEALRRFPFMGNLLSMAMYHESGIPSLDVIAQTATSAWYAAHAKTRATREKQTIRAVSGAAQMLGVPGASIIGEIAEKSR